MLRIWNFNAIKVNDHSDSILHQTNLKFNLHQKLQNYSASFITKLCTCPRHHRLEQWCAWNWFSAFHLPPTKCPPGSSLPNVKLCRRCIKRCQSSQFWRVFLPSGRHEASLLCLRPRLSSGIGMSSQMSFLWQYSLMTYLFPFQSVWVKPLIQETYTETRDITDSAGNTFSCLYTIVYDPSRKVLGQFFCKYFTPAR